MVQGPTWMVAAAGPIAQRHNPDFPVRQCNAASNGRWPMAYWRHSITGPDQARSRQLRRRPRLGWCLWHATRRKVIRKRGLMATLAAVAMMALLKRTHPSVVGDRT